MNKTQLALNRNSTSEPKKKKKSVSLDVKKSRAGWLFVLPFVIGFALVYIPIIIDSLRLSFMEGNGTTLTFIGWDNYSYALFEDTTFVETLVTGMKQLIIDIPAIVIFSLFMAVLLNQKMFGRAAFRAIFFVPVILSTGLIARMDQSNALLNYMSGNEGINTGNSTSDTSATDIISSADVTKLFSSMKVGTGLVGYVTSLVNDIYGIINRSGVQMLIFLAGLQSISPAIYESCSIDGATSWETFWKITFPMISPMILVNTIYTVIDSFTSSDNTVMTKIQTVYKDNMESVASAMGWIYFLIVILIVAVVAGILSAYIFYQRKD